MIKKLKKISVCLILLITMFAACNKVFAFAKDETYHRNPTNNDPNADKYYDNIVYKVNGNKAVEAMRYKISRHTGYRYNDGKFYEMYCLDPAKQPYNNNDETTLITVSVLSCSVPTDLALMYIMSQQEYSSYYPKSIAVRSMQTFSDYYNNDASSKAGLVKAYINASTWWTLNGYSNINKSSITSDEIKALLGIDVKAGDSSQIDKVRAMYRGGITGYTSYMLSDGSISGATAVDDVKTAQQIYVNAVKYAASYTNQRNPQNKRKISVTSVSKERKYNTVCKENNTIQVTDTAVVDVTLYNFLKTKLANNIDDDYKLAFDVEADNKGTSVAISSIQYSMDGGKTYAAFDKDAVDFASLIKNDKTTVRFKIVFKGILDKSKASTGSFKLKVYTYYKVYGENALSGAYLVANTKSHPRWQRFLVAEGDIYKTEVWGNSDSPSKLTFTWKDNCGKTCSQLLKEAEPKCNATSDCKKSDLNEFNKKITQGQKGQLVNGKIACSVITLHLCNDLKAQGKSYTTKEFCEKSIDDYGFMEDGHLAHCVKNAEGKYEVSCEAKVCKDLEEAKEPWTAKVAELSVACRQDPSKDADKVAACLELVDMFDLANAEEARLIIPSADAQTITCSKTSLTCESFDGNKYKDVYGIDTCNNAKKKLSTSERAKVTCVGDAKDTLICNATCNSLRQSYAGMDDKYKYGEWAAGNFTGILTKYDNLYEKSPKEAEKVGLNKNTGLVVCNKCEDYQGKTYRDAGYSSFEQLKENVSDPDITYYENNQVVCKKTNCALPPDKNNKSEWARWIKDCCHFESAGKESIEYMCNDKKDQKYCEMYENYCRVCDTKFNMDTTCVDITEKEFSSDEFKKDRKGTIEGPTDIALCILDDSVNGRENNSRYLLSKDDKVVPFDPIKQVGNPYCTVYCKEDYNMNLPAGRYVISGRYFTLGMNMDAKKTCYSTNIDYNRFNADFEAAKAAISAATTNEDKLAAYNRYTTVVNNINSCAAGWDDTYLGWNDTVDKVSENEFSPKVSYTYDEKEYVDMYPKDDLKMQRRTNEVTVTDSFCVGNVDDTYNYCNNGQMSSVKSTRTYKGYNCGLNNGVYSCTETNVEIPTVNYAKKEIATKSLYTSGSYFMTKYSTGVITKVGSNDCPDFYKKDENGNPIADLNSTCKYTLVESKLHQDLNNAGKVIVEGGLPVKLKNDVGVYNYKFKFDNFGEFYDKQLTGRLIDSDKTKKPEIDRNISTKNEATDHENSHPFKGSYVCSYIVNCPECKVKCVDDPSRGYYCNLPDCNGGQCKTSCRGEHCAFNQTGTLYTIHQTSLINLATDDKARENVGFNWDDKQNPKAAETISRITETGESAYDKPEYSFTFTPAVISKIREYNNKNKNADGYLNDSMTCQLYSTKLRLLKAANEKINGQEITDEMIAQAELNDYNVCKSDLLSQLQDQYKTYTHLDSREKVESFLTSEYCQNSENECYFIGSLAIGPAWK